MIKLKHAMVACVLTLPVMPSVCAQNASDWMDVTGSIIKNADFSDWNANNWTFWNNNVQNMGFQGSSYTNGDVNINGFLEMWRPASSGSLGNGEMTQSVTLPKGAYLLQADAIASWQKANNVEVTGVYLMARTENGETFSTPLYTNNNLPEHFTLQFDLTKKAQVALGVLIQNTNANWVAADNFKLSILAADFVPITSMVLNKSVLTMDVAESYQLSVNYLPVDAFAGKFTYSSSNQDVARVSETGVVKTIGVGTANIIARNENTGLTATCKVTSRNMPFVANALVINEIQSSNVDCVMDPSFNYGSWIELYNPTDQACGLGGLYITDDPSNLTKFRLPSYMGAVPAHGFRNIWFDHHDIWNFGELKQVDFKLDYEGGTIILSNGSTIIAQQDYPQMPSRACYARTEDGGDTWAMSSTPTPGTSNHSMTFVTEQVPAPVVDTDGQLFDGSLTVRVTIPAGTTLKYTTDGSLPTLSNGEVSTTGVFDVNNSTAYRFRLFQEGLMPSEVVTRSYINENRGLAVIALTTDNATLYGETGLFDKGENGRSGNGQDEKCNWNMSWDRPVNFEFITEDNEYALSQQVDMAMCGGWSRAWSPHSFKLKAAKYYQGKNFLEYEFFDAKPFLKHKTLQIRNGGNNGLLKDASLQEVMRRSGLNIETQSWRPVNVYINGEFYAQLNMREPNNKHYAYANYGFDSEVIDQFEMSPDSGYVQMTGTREAFDKLVDLSYKATDAATYQEIGKLLDIDEFINYMSAEIYLGNWDWPQNNVKGFRSIVDGKFRFVVFDLDGCDSNKSINQFMNTTTRWTDALRGEDVWGNSLWGQSHEAELYMTTLFNNLVKNPQFRRQFVDAFCVMSGSTFRPDFARPIVDEMAAQMNYWYNHTGDMIQNLHTNMPKQLANSQFSFGVTESDAVQVKLQSNVEGAAFYANDVPVPTGQFDGRLYLPMTLKAVAPTGYKFSGWQGLNDVSYQTTTIFQNGAEWQYYDGGSLDGQAWQQGNVGNGWKTGNTMIGYNSANNLPTQTTKFLPTYYFRKNMTLAAPVVATDVFTLNYTVDDGFIVYVNGKEAGRYNMPNGEVYYNTVSTTYANGNPDVGSLTLDASLFHEGENCIAVEVHNNQTSSSDIMWDANITLKQVVGVNEDDAPVSAELKLTNTDSKELMAIFTPLTDEELAAQGVTPVKVNEVSASNDIYMNDQFKKDDWFELYNTTDREIDIAGMYLSDDETQPQKFQVPSNDQLQTVIAPHGRLVVWASQRAAKGEQIHTNFKLGNKDGERVIITSADGEWSDSLTYVKHDSKTTVGVYPDGGNEVYHMQLPSIGNANRLTSYAQYLYTKTYPTQPEEQDFTLTLNEGWNWISHPLARQIETSEIRTNALCIKGQTAQTAIDSTGVWSGALTSIVPAQGYKMQMAQDDQFTFTEPLYNPESGSYLHQGWNWIGYTLNAPLSVEVALSKLTPQEGDKLMGRDGFITFENGKWDGTLTRFVPGQGYLYKAAQPTNLVFTTEGGNAVKARASARFEAQPRTPWSVSSADYPDVMGVVAQVINDDKDCTDGSYSISAFGADGECRGVGMYTDGRLYLILFGNTDETLTLKAAEEATGVVYDVNEQLNFTEDVMGSRLQPIQLHIGAPSDVASVKYGAGIASVSYYTLSGVCVGQSAQSLPQGIYVKKARLTNGTVITTKVIIK